VAPESVNDVKQLFSQQGLEEFTEPVGVLIKAGAKRIVVTA
jgi:hypothetical protein